MKTVHIACIVCLLSVVSCSTMHKFVVSGNPGTEIYSPSFTKLGTIDSNGQVEVAISSNSGFEYLWSKSPGNNYIPFALDYRQKNYTGDKILKYTGIGLTAYGLGYEVVGGIIALAAEPELGLAFAGAGCVAALVGVGLGYPASQRLQQRVQNWNFTYLETQLTNSDIVQQPIIDNGEKKQTDKTEVKSVSTSSKRSLSSVKTSNASRANRTLNNYANTISGVYEGTGQLLQEGRKIESYAKVRIEIAAIDRITVSVDVIEGGESFFYSAMEYSVSKDKNGGYKLISKEIPDAIITINASDSLKYIHPSVNIEGAIYSLEITGSK